MWADRFHLPAARAIGMEATVQRSIGLQAEETQTHRAEDQSEIHQSGRRKMNIATRSETGCAIA